MIQMMVVDEVFQIFGVGVEIMGPQYRSLWHTAVDCARARLLIVDLCSITEIWLNHFKAVSFAQNRSCSTRSMIGWSTVSKAALRSSSTRGHNLPLSIVLAIMLWTAETAVSVEWNERFVDGWWGKSPCSSACSTNLHDRDDPFDCHSW